MNSNNRGAKPLMKSSRVTTRRWPSDNSIDDLCKRRLCANRAGTVDRKDLVDGFIAKAKAADAVVMTALAAHIEGRSHEGNEELLRCHHG